MTLIEALINSRNAADEKEAALIVGEMSNRVYDDGEDPEEVLADYGLEPDYVMDLLN